MTICLVTELVHGERAPGGTMARRTARTISSRTSGSNSSERVAPEGTHDAELDVPVGDLVDHGLRVPDRECDVQVGMLPLEVAEEQRD